MWAGQVIGLGLDRRARGIRYQEGSLRDRETQLLAVIRNQRRLAGVIQDLKLIQRHATWRGVRRTFNGKDKLGQGARRHRSAPRRAHNGDGGGRGLPVRVTPAIARSSARPVQTATESSKRDLSRQLLARTPGALPLRTFESSPSPPSSPEPDHLSTDLVNGLGQPGVRLHAKKDPACQRVPLRHDRDGLGDGL